MNLFSVRRYRLPWLVAASVALAGCQGMYLYNPDRAAVAETAKTSIDSVKIDAISKTEQGNLDKLLEQELKSIDDRAKLVATLAVVDLSVSDQSIAQHYGNALRKMQLWLHTDSMAALQEGTQCTIRKKGAEKILDSAGGELEGFGVEAPKCTTDIAQTIAPPADLTDLQRKDLLRSYARYVESCRTSLLRCSVSADTRLLDDAINKRDADRKASDAARTALADARKEYEKAVSTNRELAESAEQTEEKIRAAAQKLADAVGTLAEVSPVVADQLKGAALVDLLNAAATGKSESTDASLAPALEIAKSAPGLAQSIAVARANKSMVPTSHLLLALNNLTIQAERDARLAALNGEEIAILERKVTLLDRQARLWRKYSDELCNLVYLGASKKAPGNACDTLALKSLDDGTVQCAVTLVAKPQVPPLVVPNCILAKTWRELFASATLNAQQKRALYEAAAAYLQVRLVTYEGVAEDFRRLDIANRRAVVEREAALAQWKNVVAVPANTLEGYYKGGVKPSELADLIVKALGFTAIAIGVAQ